MESLTLTFFLTCKVKGNPFEFFGYDIRIFLTLNLFLEVCFWKRAAWPEPLVLSSLPWESFLMFGSHFLESAKWSELLGKLSVKDLAMRLTGYVSKFDNYSCDILWITYAVTKTKSIYPLNPFFLLTGEELPVPEDEPGWASPESKNEKCSLEFFP